MTLAGYLIANGLFLQVLLLGPFSGFPNLLGFSDNLKLISNAAETEALAQSVNVHTEDMREAFLAYVERRPPEFKGR